MAIQNGGEAGLPRSARNDGREPFAPSRVGLRPSSTRAHPKKPVLHTAFCASSCRMERRRINDERGTLSPPARQVRGTTMLPFYFLRIPCLFGWRIKSGSAFAKGWAGKLSTSHPPARRADGTPAPGFYFLRNPRFFGRPVEATSTSATAPATKPNRPDPGQARAQAFDWLINSLSNGSSCESHKASHRGGDVSRPGDGVFTVCVI